MGQQFPSFSASVTGSLEDNFSTHSRRVGERGDGSGSNASNGEQQGPMGSDRE